MSLPRILVLLALALTGPLAVAQRADVLPPARRADTVELARRLTAPPVAPDVAERPANPFAPNAAPAPEVPNAVSTAPARASSRQLLEAMAPLINPSGVMNLGGEPILLFGQKRIKVGDTLPLTFDGKPYVLVITSIQNTSFTLRLDGEETTRPIKLATRP